MRLHTVIVSTRPGRVGPAVARWFHEFASRHGGFECELVDVADFGLPVYDEAEHPRTGKYAHEHTRKWSASAAAADAFAFVTPEYNFGPSPAFVNAITFLSREWARKPCGFVSYGGMSGGLRAVQAQKLVVTALNMMPLSEGVAVPGVHGMLSSDRQTFKANDLIDKSARDLLDELHKWAEALRSMRG